MAGGARGGKFTRAGRLHLESGARAQAEVLRNALAVLCGGILPQRNRRDHEHESGYCAREFVSSQDCSRKKAAVFQGLVAGRQKRGSCRMIPPALSFICETCE